jgi:hypothetical protein
VRNPREKASTKSFREEEAMFIELVVRSLGVNSVPFVFITDLCCVFALMMIFKWSLNVF